MLRLEPGVSPTLPVPRLPSPNRHPLSLRPVESLIRTVASHSRGLAIGEERNASWTPHGRLWRLWLALGDGVALSFQQGYRCLNVGHRSCSGTMQAARNRSRLNCPLVALRLLAKARATIALSSSLRSKSSLAMTSAIKQKCRLCIVGLGMVASADSVNRCLMVQVELIIK